MSIVVPGASGADLQERREAVVREHMESENHHDFDTTIATFAHPRYEIIPTGDEQEVRRYFAETRTAFCASSASPGTPARSPAASRCSSTTR